MKIQRLTTKKMAILSLSTLFMVGLAGCYGIQSSVVEPEPVETEVAEVNFEETDLVEYSPAQVEIAPTPIPVILTYTNETYGFTFDYPEIWTLTEEDHGVLLQKGTNHLIIRFRWIYEDVPEFGPSGLPAGDLLYKEVIRFFDQVIPAEALSYECKTKMVLYGETGYVEVKNLLFLIMLEDSPSKFNSVDIAEEIINEAKAVLESFMWIAAVNGSEEIGNQSRELQGRKDSSNFWVTVEEPNYGIRFVVPCFWHVDFPMEGSPGHAYSIRNYGYVYSLTFPGNDKDFWESGGIKIDINFVRRKPRGISMDNYITRFNGENGDSKLVYIEEIEINGQKALLATVESVFGIGHIYLFDLNEDAFLLFIPSPESINNPDVQAILHSIAIDPDTPIVMPGFPPGYPPEEVITGCMGLNELEVLLSSPQSLSWGSGEPVKVHFALINLTSEKLYVLDWFTPFEGIVGDIFRVTYNGQPIPYQGIHAMRENPSPESYIVLEPAGTEIVEVNLSEVYDFSRPGIYSIAYKSPPASDMALSEDAFVKTLDELGPVYIPSNEITVEIVLEND
jgi:hypothetical protein